MRVVLDAASSLPFSIVSADKHLLTHFLAHHNVFMAVQLSLCWKV